MYNQYLKLRKSFYYSLGLSGLSFLFSSYVLSAIFMSTSAITYHLFKIFI